MRSDPTSRCSSPPTDSNPEPQLDAPAPAEVARRSNGESVLHEHGSTRYTTQDLLDAEQRLLGYAAQPTNLGLVPLTCSS